MAVARLVARPYFSGSKQKCGPTALAIITGATTDEAVNALHTLRGNNEPVGTTYWREFLQASKFLGTELVDCDTSRPCNLNQFYRMLSYEQKKQQIAVLITNHFITIKDGIVVDSWYPLGRKLGLSAHGRKRVRAFAFKSQDFRTSYVQQN